MPSRNKIIRKKLFPKGVNEIEAKVDGRVVSLTNLNKIFWPEGGITKGDLIQYYADISEFLLPHIKDRAMVMKRFPNGAYGDFFFMKRAPRGKPEWIATCPIKHSSGNTINFPVINTLPGLLWLINLGCIDLNQWYARCDDVYRPDYLHFDLDPVEGAGFATVSEVAILVAEHLMKLQMSPLIKTSGSKGIHIYVAIQRGPLQKQVWDFAKEFSVNLAKSFPELITGEYRIAKRPAGTVLVDYNQNAWGRTLASVYSVRPKPGASVSMPVTFDELKSGIKISDFTIANARQRIGKVGDLWKSLLSSSNRVDLERFFK